MFREMMTRTFVSNRNKFTILVLTLASVWFSASAASAQTTQLFYQDSNMTNTTMTNANETLGYTNSEWWWRGDVTCPGCEGWPGVASDTSQISDHMYSNNMLGEFQIQDSAITIDFNAAGLGPNDTADVWIVWGEFQNNTDGIKYNTTEPIVYTEGVEDNGVLVDRNTMNAVQVDRVGAGTATTDDLDGFGSLRFRYKVGPLTADSNGEAKLYVGLGNGVSTYFDGVAIGSEDVVEPTVHMWDTNVGGSWHGNSNWSTNLVPNGSDQTAILGSAIDAPATVSVDSNVTVKRIDFDSANTYAVAGTQSVTLESDEVGVNSEINVIQGSHQFQAVVNLANDTDLFTAPGTTLTLNNELNLQSNTFTKTGDGTLAINNRIATAGGMVDCQGGTCSGSGTVGGNLNNSGGTVAPGNSPGILTIDGNYTQSNSGTLALEISGLIPGEEHDKLVVNGTATLDGTLDVTLINGFTLAGDMLFDVLDFNSVVNDFTTFNLPTGLVWNVSDGTLCFGNCVGGLTDYDNDGTWGLGDLNLVLFNWNEDGANLPPAWLNSRPGAGTLVGLPELNQVLFSWGQPGSLAAVPEPGACLLLLIAALGAWSWQRRI